MRVLIFCLPLAIALAACQPAAAPDIAVRDVWARATAPGQSGAAYLVIDNRGGTADRLVGVSSPRAAMAMLHGSSEEGGVVSMRHEDSLEVPRGDTLTLAPLGRHVMLDGLNAPFRAGERVPLTLRFEKSGARSVDAIVVAAGSAGPGR